MKKKEIIEKLFGFTEATYYNWKKENRPIINLIKYFNDEELIKFLETGKIDRLEKNNNNNKDLEDFILNTALNKIVEAFGTKKVNDNYILIAIASAIENSQDKYEIRQKIITYLAEDHQEARRARGVFIMMSEIETDILIKNKNKVIKKFEEYIRTMDNLSSLYQFNYFLDIDDSIKI